mgnify:CR=1 FL=1
MKLRPMQNEREPHIMIIPMIDIIFFLLVFFMMSMLSMTVEHSVPLQLPQAATAALQTEASLTVGVTADGRIFVEEEPVSRADFSRRMAAERERNPDVNVVLRADEDARHADVLFVLDGLRSAGISRIGIAADPGETP